LLNFCGGVEFVGQVYRSIRQRTQAGRLRHNGADSLCLLRWSRGMRSIVTGIRRAKAGDMACAAHTAL
jgi:hypothetical protein